MALWYALGYVVGLPVAMFLVVAVVLLAAPARLDPPPGSRATIAVSGGYLALSAVHVTYRWWHNQREIQQARRANLFQGDAGGITDQDA